MLGYMAQHGFSFSESIFCAVNPTPGTGIVCNPTATTFSKTAGLMNIYNSAKASAAKADIRSNNNQWIVPICLRLTATQTNTAASVFRLVGVLDGSDRYTSGGTNLSITSTSVDTRTGYSSRTPKADIDFGNLVLVTSDTKHVFNTIVAQNILNAGETIEVWFGEGPNTSQTNLVKVVPPVWIGRESSLAIHEVVTGQTDDAAFEVEFWFAEIQHKKVL